jgi:hypothetical protein
MFETKDMNFEKKNYFYKPFPFIIIKDFMNKDFSTHLKNEIINFDNYDDKVMVNRKRIYKGSKNFNKLLLSSKCASQIYNNLNSIEMFKFFYNLFDLKKSNWKVKDNLGNFSKNYFGKQEDTIYESIVKFLALKNIIQTRINLDIDFSMAGKGYNRGPHRDRETRVLNFLIYLNDFKKEDGGDFQIFDYKNNDKIKYNNYPRFPKEDLVLPVHSILPEQGKLVLFLSTPNSYHAAGEFLRNDKKRVFIYGSYSLNKKATWVNNY